ncbi:hypothetical protein [Methylobacterium persicinum]|uniref:HTH cro/C1-type domain-containing protein n=1 Tax=Methylobacterium persicinum TaxID=374426 RepID=A0ABU0HTT6_9HYPH|nr:hypothetical protein [Methylobacterium persicinum]MDQ0445258.1 hypothetical protein [Methylobacterium persicinum]
MTAIAKYSRRNPEPRKQRRSTVTIPERASPAVKLVFAEMNRQNKTYDSVEAGSGINRPTVKAWRHKNHPNLESISAVLGFLNFEFVPIPRERALPDSIREALKPIADLLRLEMRDAVGFAFEIAYRQPGRST